MSSPQSLLTVARPRRFSEWSTVSSWMSEAMCSSSTAVAIFTMRSSSPARSAPARSVIVGRTSFPPPSTT